MPCFICGVKTALGLPWCLSGEEAACQAGDAGLIPGSGRSPGAGNGNPLQYSRPENSTDTGLQGYSLWDRKRGSNYTTTMTVLLGNVWFSQGYCEGKEVVFAGIRPPW